MQEEEIILSKISVRDVAHGSLDIQLNLSGPIGYYYSYWNVILAR